jgi:hypothetical protein
VNAETTILLGQGVEVLLEKNILGSDVGKDEIHLGLVAGSTSANDGANDLEHGSDASASSNHAKVADHVGGVDESALGAANANCLADQERGHVLGDVALRIRLDQEVDESRLVVAGNRGIRSDDFLDGSIRLRKVGANGDVLADGKTQDVLLRGELESVARGFCCQIRRSFAV